MAFFDTSWYIKDNGVVGYSAVGQWTALTAYSAGQWVRQLATPTVNNERCFVCIIAGTSLAVEPTWVVTRGAKTAEASGPTWQECTGMAGPNGDLTNAPIWVASRVITLGEVYYDAVSASLQICSTAGTSKTGAAPTFSATAGVTTTDNTVTWTSLGPTSNYTGWQYPFPRLQACLTTTWSAPGNNVYVSNNHAETQATGLTLLSTGTAALPISIYCVSDATAPSTTLATTATISTTGANNLSLSGGVSAFSSYYGLNFFAGSGASTANLGLLGQGGYTTFDNCTFNLNNTSATSSIFWFPTTFTVSNSGSAVYRNCNFTFGATGQKINTATGTGGWEANFIGCTFAGTGSIPALLFVMGSQSISIFRFRDCDMSSVTGTLFSSTNPGQIDISNCKLGAGVVLGLSASSSAQSFMRLVNSDSSNTNYRYAFSTFFGLTVQETTIVRTGGSTDGTTPISWNITTNASTNATAPFFSDIISQWNDTVGTITANIYLTSNTVLDNSKVWVEWEDAGTSGFPLGVAVLTRAPFLSSPSTLTSDTSTWGGSITNKYVISSTLTPQNKGPLKARIYVSVPSTTLYVDAQISITGVTPSRSYTVGEMGRINETSSGSSGSGGTPILQSATIQGLGAPL